MLMFCFIVILRMSFNKGKFEYIYKIGVIRDFKMFKYVVVIIGVMRMEII